MASILRRVIGRLQRITRNIKARREISLLYRQDSLISKSLSSALKSTLKGHIAPEEEVWISRIESLRKALNSSITDISIVDYGAGTPDLPLTNEEMYHGKVKSRTIGDVCRSASKSNFWLLLLFKLIREFKPSVCLELGTCLGISAAYQAAALMLNQNGKIVTLEGSDSLAALAKQHFQSLGLDNINVVVGRFQNTLDKVLNEQCSIDYAFIDGHHDERATLRYFEQIYPFLSARAILVFDDISWSEGMRRAWSAIETDKRVKISVDLSTVGICIIDSTIERRQNLKIPIV